MRRADTQPAINAGLRSPRRIPRWCDIYKRAIGDARDRAMQPNETHTGDSPHDEVPLEPVCPEHPEAQTYGDEENKSPDGHIPIKCCACGTVVDAI